MTWDVQLAKMFKDRDNKTSEEVMVANVINTMPNIKLSLGEDIVLETDDLIISSRIYELTLYPGDTVIVVPSANGQLFYVIDKVGAKHVS